MEKERRTHKRFKTLEGTYAVMNSYGEQICPVLDISMGGISFLYLSNNGVVDKSDQLEILVAGKGLGIAELPCMEVLDFKVDLAEASGSLEKRRACLSFNGLNQRKKEELDLFIRKVMGFSRPQFL